MTWTFCDVAPGVSDVVRWEEPIWAPPNKKRGKPDEVGMQRLTAEVVEIDDVGFQLRVIDVETLSLKAGAVLKVKPGDIIRRKISTLERGDCHLRGSQFR